MKKTQSQEHFLALFLIFFTLSFTVIHHLCTTGKIIGYSHDFCNKKLRESQNMIPVFAHNLFRQDIFFVVMGIRLCIWRNKSVNISGTNFTKVQYTNIGNQVKILDTITYYQQSLFCLASSTNGMKKENKKIHSKFYKKTQIFLASIWLSNRRRKNWVLSYLSVGEESHTLREN